VRVLFLVSGYPSTKNPANGIFHKTQAEALDRLGVTVEVVAPLPAVPFGLHLLKRRWREYRAVPRRYVLNRVQIRRPRYLHWPLRMYVGAGAERAFGRATLRVLQTKPDLVHAHVAYPPGMAAAWLARRLGIPSVLTLHGRDVNVLPEINQRSLTRFGRAVAAADAVIAVSEALADRTEQLTRRRPVVLRIGIQMDSFRTAPSRQDARHALRLPQDAPVVAYVGHLARSKGLLELLEGLRRLAGAGVRGMIVGEGPLRSTVERATGVSYYGLQPNERIPLLMAAADVLVLASHSEGLPTVVVEAGAVGVPVIATAVGGIPEILGCDRGILIPPGSVDALVEAIRNVLADRKAAAERAACLRRHVEELYDADRNAARLLDIYRALR
jgi:teichuronic acid biosynthesis glycosyltransferase TuaC